MFKGKAKSRWRDAYWIEGDGPFAVLAHCGVLTVTLWRTQQEAERAKGAIDRFGCGHACNLKAHEIQVLEHAPLQEA